MPLEGTTFTYLKHLVLFEHDFTYKKKRYDYADVKHIHFFSKQHQEAQETSPEISKATLTLEFTSGEMLRIKHKTLISAKTFPAALQALTLAAEELSEKTFTFRLEHYETIIKKTQAYPWGKYHIHINGDLLKGQKKILNLKKNINCYLYPFYVTCRPAHPNLIHRFQQYIRRDFATLSLKQDRDCLLFLFKHYINLSWKTEEIRQKSTYTSIATPSLLKLAAHLSNVDGHISKQEIEAFKSYFNLTDKSTTDHASIFNSVKNTPISVEEEATSIFKVYKHNTEALQHILKGFIYTALAQKKKRISDAQMDVLTHITYYFQIPIAQFTKLYTEVLKTEKIKQDFYRNTHQQRSNAKKQTPDQSKSPLDILGLPPKATWKDVKITYRTLARRYHPDLMTAQGKSPVEIKKASEILKEINIAYTTLEKKMA